MVTLHICVCVMFGTCSHSKIPDLFPTGQENIGEMQVGLEMSHFTMLANPDMVEGVHRMNVSGPSLVAVWGRDVETLERGPTRPNSKCSVPELVQRQTDGQTDTTPSEAGHRTTKTTNFLCLKLLGNSSSQKRAQQSAVQCWPLLAWVQWHHR